MNRWERGRESREKEKSERVEWSIDWMWHLCFLRYQLTWWRFLSLSLSRNSPTLLSLSLSLWSGNKKPGKKERRETEKQENIIWYTCKQDNCPWTWILIFFLISLIITLTNYTFFFFFPFSYLSFSFLSLTFLFLLISESENNLMDIGCKWKWIQPENDRFFGKRYCLVQNSQCVNRVLFRTSVHTGS